MAKIIDIKNIDISKIKSDEVFAIDTNALIWTHYSKASDPNLNKHPYQVIAYPNFISRLLQNGNKIVTTTLNISELCGVVEKNEYELYKAIHSQKNLKFKDYRKQTDQRRSYKEELDTMIMEIKDAYDNQIEIVEIDPAIILSFQSEICNNRCDIFDYAIIEYFKKMRIVNYISDDKDFETIDGINLYTTYEIP
jgi:predicted nucleic acid-binding protein